MTRKEMNMKQTFFLITLVALFCITTGFASCAKDASPPNRANIQQENASVRHDTERNAMNISIGTQTFTATLFDNETAAALKAILPVTLDMNELNGNEKYYHFSTTFPTNASNHGTINAGDVMLWGNNSLVLFYKTFTTSYSYTKIGRIDDASGLAAAVGSGNVTITFELE